MQILIPSAKIVPPELQRIGKIPAVLYPLNDGTVLDSLMNLYQEYRRIIIVGYESFESLEHGVSVSKNNNIELVRLDRIEDLGYSILKGLENVDKSEPVIVNFGDTIVEDVAEQLSCDSFYYVESEWNNKWTYFIEENGIIQEIYDKNSECKGQSGKLFVGVFVIEHTDDFQNCIIESLKEKHSCDSFYFAIQKYSRMHHLHPLEARHWFDIGHIDNYYNSKLGVKARDFNHICIDKERGILRKESEDKAKFIGEIEWYIKLPLDVEYVRPRIFNFSTSWTNPYVEMEYYSYHTVHELFLYGDLSKKQWERIFRRIRFIINDFSKYTVKSDKIESSLKEMYLDKTLERLDNLRNNPSFAGFFVNPITCNGVVYQPLDRIVKILMQSIPEMLYNIDSFHIIHGDLCFANIMVDDNQNFVKLIDPRGKFGTFDLYGDVRYELAKIWHSVDGKYDYIIKDLFYLDYDLNNNHIEFSINQRKLGFNLYQTIIECFKSELNESVKEVELIEALLFLSMIPLHKESREHQIVMLCTGLQILNRVIDIEGEEK